MGRTFIYGEMKAKRFPQRVLVGKSARWKSTDQPGHGQFVDVDRGQSTFEVGGFRPFKVFCKQGSARGGAVSWLEFKCRVATSLAGVTRAACATRPPRWSLGS